MTRLIATTLLVSLTLVVTACGPSREERQWAKSVTGGDPDRGQVALRQYGCIACHTIDGMRDSAAVVGPPLTRMASRSYLAGNLTNNASNLVRWIQRPREIHKDTAMPDTGVSDAEARDIASYLYQFH